MSNEPPVENSWAEKHVRPEDREYIKLSRDAYRTSEDWFQNSVRREIEDAYRLFHSEHPEGSKYYSPDFAKRSKIFRPLTRKSIRSNEAATATALFSTREAVKVLPHNPRNPDHVMGAKIRNNILNYRLENTFPWFQTCIGGAQDALTTGVVISKQTWEFEEREIKVSDTRVDPFTGLEYEAERAETIKVRDTFCIDLIPVENLRMDQACNWVDPIRTSPYLIEAIPLYFSDLQDRISLQSKFPGLRESLDVESLQNSLRLEWDSIRRAREQNRTDKYDDKDSMEYQVLWAYEHIHRRRGVDMVWYTLENGVLLTDPTELRNVYKHGRPYTMGTTMLESHRLYPGGIPKLGQDLNVWANDIANSRVDNLHLALNKRYLAKRGTPIDLRSLTRNVPGSITMTGDPDRDVKVVETKDVTASAYNEQDRINLDHSDLIGSFNQATVGAQKAMSETVGGMELFQTGANQLQEYGIQTFTRTWVNPTLAMCAEMISLYESDQEVITDAAIEAGLEDPKRALSLLKERCKLSVKTGFGATSPQQKIQSFAYAAQTAVAIDPSLGSKMDSKEVIEEIFGAVGLDAKRLFPSVYQSESDPEKEALMAQVQEMQRVIETKQIEANTKIQVAQMNNEQKDRSEELRATSQMQREQMRSTVDATEADLKRRQQDLNEKIAASRATADRKKAMIQMLALSQTMESDEREFFLNLFDRGLAEGPDGERAVLPDDLEPPDAPVVSSDRPAAIDESPAGVISRGNYGSIPLAEG